MPNTAINFGRILIFLGVIGYAYGYFYNPPPSPTALIPAVFGAILMVLGYAARAKENLRKLLMHIAVVVGLLGFIIPAGRIVSKLGDFALTVPMILIILMAIVCLSFVILSVKSFINARQAS